MKFMVEFKPSPGNKEKILDLFELRGPNRTPGVTFRGAWIGTRSDVIFVLSECAEQALLESACCGWEPYGSWQVHPVVDVEQI